MADDKVFYVRKANASDCKRDGNAYLKDSRYELFIGGACVYSRKRHYLPVGVEKMGMVRARCRCTVAPALWHA
jgi:hypothetical protein